MIYGYNIRSVTSINDANFLWNSVPPHTSEQFNRESDESLIPYELMKKTKNKEPEMYIPFDYLKDV
jgi:hypothetical protein